MGEGGLLGGVLGDGGLLGVFGGLTGGVFGVFDVSSVVLAAGSDSGSLEQANAKDAKTSEQPSMRIVVM